MSEMQTLNVRPESREHSSRGALSGRPQQDIKIDPIDIKTKQKVLEWLANDIKMLKYNQRLIEDLPLYCKNGVFLCDLANRLSGR